MGNAEEYFKLYQESQARVAELEKALERILEQCREYPMNMHGTTTEFALIVSIVARAATQKPEAGKLIKGGGVLQAPPLEESCCDDPSCITAFGDLVEEE